MAEFSESIPTVIAHEGGYCEIAGDPGGATKFGVSWALLRDHQADLEDLGIQCSSADEIKNLTQSDAETILKRYFWKFDGVTSQDVATKILDAAVNMGEPEAIHRVQRTLQALGAPLVEDGTYGPKTEAALNAVDPVVFLATIREHLASFYQVLVSRRPELGKFLDGWLERAAA